MSVFMDAMESPVEHKRKNTMSEQAEVKKTENKDIVESKGESSLSLFSDFDRFFQDFAPFNMMKALRRDWPAFPEFELKTPKVDIIDRDDTIIVKAEIPGIEKKDLDISVSENSVTIKGETKSESKEEKDDYIHSEIKRGSVLRTVPLPCPVNSDAASAKFTDGMLELTLPKATRATKQKIEIS